METKNYDFSKTRNKDLWYLAIPVSALLFQLIPPIFLWKLSDFAYAELRYLPELWEQALSFLTLAVAAGVSFLLGSLGIYKLLTRARLIMATLLIVVCCLPALLGGAFYLHGLLIFLTLV